MGALKRLLMAVGMGRKPVVVKAEDVADLRSVLDKLEQPRLTIKERRELVRKAKELEDASQKED